MHQLALMLFRRNQRALDFQGEEVRKYHFYQSSKPEISHFTSLHWLKLNN